MYRKTILSKVVIAMLIPTVLLTGCQSATPVPTQDPAIIEATTNVIRTQAVETVVADLTQNAPTATNTAAPSATPTETLVPTATAIPVTATPIPPTATATIAWPTWTLTPSFTPAPSQTPTSFKCSISEQSPEYGATFQAGADYDAVWTVKNTGSTTWTASSADARYLSGTKMQKKVDAVDLGSDVAKDQTVKIALDMIAPNDPGRYTATWGIVDGSTTLCVFNVTINVTK